MKKSLIIVESPAKIKTLKKLLGKNFVFASSVGHIRDLPVKSFGIDVENNFEPKYEILLDKKEVIQNIQKLAKDCDTIYLAPDPDREGEAIAWHIASLLSEKKFLFRISFNAITQQAVSQALKKPRNINLCLVNAQQARRLLDRIVGYKISPILSRKLQQRSGVSAGRVQSVALKLVVDREKEIESFIPKEYWIIKVFFSTEVSSHKFAASLYSVDGKKVEKEPTNKPHIIIDSQEKAKEITDVLEKSSFKIKKLDSKEKKRNPLPPFITSTLQQEASRHFRFTASKTMSIAQTLYEGVDLGNEEVIGLITYMRTDSVRTEPEAVEASRKYILEHFGDNYIPEKPNSYMTKKHAQDAHEAIRPTHTHLTPESLQDRLSKDQFNLYSIIWKRFIASQMTSAIFDTLAVTISTNENIILKAAGSVLKFKGFLSVYEEKTDEDPEEEQKSLPPLSLNTKLNKEEVSADQSFTKPAPRFSEASLVKELEKSGIGRPSTYATIMNKIQQREYTTKENLRLKPTELGKIIAQFLEVNFPNIMNISFTAHMEDDLELIEDNKKDWKDVLNNFWKEFIPTIETAEKEAVIPRLSTNLSCPKCKTGVLQKIWAKSKYFYGCDRYPDCDFKTSEEELSFNKEDYSPETNWDQLCPICKGTMKIRHGRYGSFLGCVNYPECKGTITLVKKEEAADNYVTEKCPAIGCDGKILKRKSRFNKIFYSCSNFPKCDIIVNNIEDLSTKYSNHIKTEYKKEKKSIKKITKKSAQKTTSSTKTQKKYAPSKELARLIGDQPISRPEATKELWNYIKKKKLQDSEDKRKIIPDKAFSEFANTKEPINMFLLAKILSSHLLE